MTMKGKYSESVQDIKVTRVTQLKTFRKEDSRAAAERGRDSGTSVFEVKGILRGIEETDKLLTGVSGDLV